jgi:hypothetical protein
MLSQGENEIQDNSKTITDNRNQVKTIGFKGTPRDTISNSNSNYERETDDRRSTIYDLPATTKDQRRKSKDQRHYQQLPSPPSHSPLDLSPDKKLL